MDEIYIKKEDNEWNNYLSDLDSCMKEIIQNEQYQKDDEEENLNRSTSDSFALFMTYFAGIPLLGLAFLLLFIL